MCVQEEITQGVVSLSVETGKMTADLLQKAVKKVPGVTSCSVSLLTNSMGVEGTASPAAILSAVQEAGYGASPKNASASKASGASADLDALYWG